MSKLTHTKLAKTMALLQAGPITAARLATEAEIHLETAKRWLRELLAHKAVHVVGWEPDKLGRDRTPVYAVGAGENTPRRKTPHAEVMRRHRARKKEHNNDA